MTAFGQRDLIDKAAALPVMGYLVKPVKEAELHAMIEIASRRHAQHAQSSHAATEADAALAQHRLLDRAKGLMMQRDGISEIEAYGRIEKRAREQRRTLLEVAEETCTELGASQAGTTRG